MDASLTITRYFWHQPRSSVGKAFGEQMRWVLLLLSRAAFFAHASLPAPSGLARAHAQAASAHPMQQAMHHADIELLTCLPARVPPAGFVPVVLIVAALLVKPVTSLLTWSVL